MKTKIYLAIGIVLTALLDVWGVLGFSFESALFSIGKYSISLLTLAAVALAVMVVIDRKK